MCAGSVWIHTNRLCNDTIALICDDDVCDQPLSECHCVSPVPRVLRACVDDGVCVDAMVLCLVSWIEFVHACSPVFIFG